VIARADVKIAAALALAMFAVFNANGREIPSYDSQPTKYAARELLLRRTLALNHVVGRTPELIERHGFQLALDGRYRSAYSPVPAITAAAIFWPAARLGIVDVRAPVAPALISAVASSLLIALAVAFAYLTARQFASRGRSLALAAGLGLGTGLWSSASQTLWQHETAIFGLSLGVLGLVLMRRGDDEQAASLQRRLALGLMVGAAVGLAGGSRLQLAPAIAVLLAAVLVRGGTVAAVAAACGAAAIIGPVCAANIRWFGSVLGAAPMLEELHEAVHGRSGSFSLYSGGYHGLLVSPNRGLFIFSPVVLVAAAGVAETLRGPRRSAALWCLVAALMQFVLYASYVVWWGGHTYGPRYMLDVLPLLVPLAAIGLARVRRRAVSVLAMAALAWSMSVAALGAFSYPHGRWNTEPFDVDRFHDRLWDWSDNQIRRAWHAGPSPQNFNLFTRDSVRVPKP